MLHTGAGIHVFNGISKGALQVPGSLPNNSLVISNNRDSRFRLRFVCRSDSTMQNVGRLIGPNGTTVTNGDIFYIVHALPGGLQVTSNVENTPEQDALTDRDQGVYTCHIPLQTGEIKYISVGIYPSGFNSE